MHENISDHCVVVSFLLLSVLLLVYFNCHLSHISMLVIAAVLLLFVLLLLMAVILHGLMFTITTFLFSLDNVFSFSQKILMQ